ncbi:DNA helicase Rep [Thiomicrorhabdus sp. 6S2-11]|jgi:ATP-dependent DNA helicase Rep|uniref:ATP-dependent DNA helicase Rep n=1 Tax=Thiomicrorhabdus marina TaxID=2818442 RepID=A0ABS3Q295_9GAMM|nr:DNA helicase Rep [Thiomicrorhabdus marina]MBO1926450.1 DNA helicase Rep [Thiomicrorhabdus marina]
MHGLNDRQLQAVLHVDTPTLVLAGAGSGKTRVITEKIAYLIRKHNYQPHHIYAVTFTNKSAKEMKERVTKLLQDDNSKGLNVSTFHNLGLNIIRREYAALGYKSNFSIMDATDAGQILKELLHKQDIDPEMVEGAQWDISNWKNAHISPEQALEMAEDEKQQARAILYQAYEKQLKAYNAVDFDDLIGLPVKLFKEQPRILDKWQNRVRYLLVDEYQDTNAAQYELVKQLVGIQARFTVVGDDDQSIYAWRGAQPENLAMLKEDFPALELIKLEQNYRSSNRILQSANTLIANNPHVFEKSLWSDMGMGDHLRVISCANENQEAERVVSEIVLHKFKNRSKNRDYAILYRGNHQARLIERALRENNLPYVISGGKSFFDHAEIKDVMSYLKLIVNPDDDAAFLRVVNTPRREIGASTLEKLATYATKRGISLFDATQEFGITQILNDNPLRRVQLFGEQLLKWAKEAEDAQGEEVISFVRSLIEEIEYDNWLHETATTPKGAERRINNVRDLVLWIERIINKALEEDGEEKRLSSIVAHMTLMDMMERNESEQEHDMVSLMTLHASKGLEFPHVFLIGMEEEFLPHKQNLESPGLEEERRLAYVGITRAKRTLTMTYASKRRKYGEDMACEPSRFLYELPEELLHWEGKPGVVITQEEKLKHGNDNLASIKSMLAGG